jgi:hypothetical protein
MPRVKMAMHRASPSAADTPTAKEQTICFTLVGFYHYLIHTHAFSEVSMERLIAGPALEWWVCILDYPSD